MDDDEYRQARDAIETKVRNLLGRL